MNSIAATSTDDALMTPRLLLEVRGISCNYDLERAVFDLLDVAERVGRGGEFKFSLVAAYPQLPSPLWLI